MELISWWWKQWLNTVYWVELPSIVEAQLMYIALYSMLVSEPHNKVHIRFNVQINYSLDVHTQRCNSRKQMWSFDMRESLNDRNKRETKWNGIVCLKNAPIPLRQSDANAKCCIWLHDFLEFFLFRMLISRSNDTWNWANVVFACVLSICIRFWTLIGLCFAVKFISCLMKTSLRTIRKSLECFVWNKYSETE